MAKKTKAKKALWTTLPNAKKYPSMATSSGPQSKRKPLRKISRKREKDSQIYNRLRVKFLASYPICSVFLARAGAWEFMRMPPSWGTALTIAVLQYLAPAATTIHHTRGRAGRLYLEPRTWIGASLIGHQWIDQNPRAASRLGLNCPQGTRNSFPNYLR